jgi:DNA repair protein RecO (recombination protein O)
MRVDEQPGFVLHARPYRETSLLLECFTSGHGRVGLVARGVRRERARFARALLQPLTPLSLSFTGRGELATLVGIESVAPPFALAGERLYCAMYVNELVLRLTARNDPNDALFERYRDALVRLVEDANPAWTLRRFERDLLAELGYAVVLDCVADTGAPLVATDDYCYVPVHGPVAWTGQSNALRVSGSALLALADDTMPTPTDLAALRRLMRALVSHQLGGGAMRSWNLLTPFNASRASS